MGAPQELALMVSGTIFLLIAALFLGPISLLNRGAPTITRERAIRESESYPRFVKSILKHFWPLHILNTVFISGALIVLIDKWDDISTFFAVVLWLIVIASTVFSGALCGMPDYVIIKGMRDRKLHQK